MRATDFIQPVALKERLSLPAQLDGSVPESAMPPYMGTFLAHLRLLIGVPFEYLVADSLLLPNESIRFFYLDRSWTDRLVDGAIAVGKIGTREQAHHQAHAADVQGQLDLTERVVRTLRRGLNASNPPSQPADVITGFLLRSAAVEGWPGMDVRAFNQVLPPNEGDPSSPGYAQWLANAKAAQLPTLRLERLSPSVLLALFAGVPQLVWCEEPHHGVQFGFTPQDGRWMLDRHTSTGAVEAGASMVPVPMRAGGNGVVAVRDLRSQLVALNDPSLVAQTGSAAFAIELLYLPWRQRFEQGQAAVNSGFVPKVQVAKVIAEPKLAQAVKELI